MTERLLEGFARFRRRLFEAEPARARALAQAQHPTFAIVACSDSRVDPALLFDAAPGDFFVIRNVAALVPPPEAEGIYHGTSAALEFAVRGLGVRHLVVLGHARCGGIRAAVRGAPWPGGFLERWVELARTACPGGDGADETTLRACERAAVRLSVDHLLTFPFVREAIERDRLSVHGWYYDLVAGRLERLVDGAT